MQQSIFGPEIGQTVHIDESPVGSGKTPGTVTIAQPLKKLLLGNRIRTDGYPDFVKIGRLTADNMPHQRKQGNSRRQTCAQCGLH